MPAVNFGPSSTGPANALNGCIDGALSGRVVHADFGFNTTCGIGEAFLHCFGSASSRIGGGLCRLSARFITTLRHDFLRPAAGTGPDLLRFEPGFFGEFSCPLLNRDDFLDHLAHNGLTFRCGGYKIDDGGTRQVPHRGFHELEKKAARNFHPLERPRRLRNS